MLVTVHHPGTLYWVRGKRYNERIGSFVGNLLPAIMIIHKQGAGLFLFGCDPNGPISSENRQGRRPQAEDLPIALRCQSLSQFPKNLSASPPCEGPC